MQVVIVLGVGRSGTTVLQRVLNTFQNTNICGENRNAWFHAAQFLEKMLKQRTDTREEYDRQDKSHFWYAWYNVVDKTTLVEQMRRLFESIYGADKWTRIGFKEIRFGQSGYDKLEAELEFFRLLYPDLKIIFNIRSEKDIVESQVKVSGKTETQAAQQFGNPQVQNFYLRYAKQHPAFVWHYENWSKPNQVKKLYDYLGEPYSDSYRRALEFQTN